MVSRILETIRSKGLSINAVEKALGFGNGAIKRFETSSPSIDKIIKLSNFLNVSIEWLVTGKEPTVAQADNSASALPTILSDDETNLIELYRKLPERKQTEFIGELKGYIKCLSDISQADPIKKIAE